MYLNIDWSSALSVFMINKSMLPGLLGGIAFFVVSIGTFIFFADKYNKNLEKKQKQIENGGNTNE